MSSQPISLELPNDTPPAECGLDRRAFLKVAATGGAAVLALKVV